MSLSPVRFWTRTALALACAVSAAPALASDCPAGIGSGPAPNRWVVGLTDTQGLVGFRTCSPERQRVIGPVSGLMPGDARVVGIDYRVQDGQLYAVADGGGIYTVNTSTAQLTKVSQLSVALSGSQFAVDFNPAANALRIISDNGQNLRHPFAVPEPRTTAVDSALNYTAGVTASGLLAAAYTNNDLDTTTGTTLFDIDGNLDQVVVQAPANAGSLSMAGKLGLDAQGPVGFDIHTRRAEGSTLANVGFATLSSNGVHGFYRVDLLTGRAWSLGTTPVPLVDIAVTLDP